MSEIVQRRDSSLDLLRIIMMLGICAIHAVHQGPIPTPRWSCLLDVCIGGFVFLSGWFGVRPSVRKILELCFQGFYGSCIAIIGLYIITGEWNLLWIGKIFRGYWFLWTYIGLMAFAPTLNILVSEFMQGNSMARNSIYLLLFAAFGWGFGGHIPYVHKIIGIPVGFGMNGIVSFIGIYIAARLFRLLEVNLSLCKSLVLAFVATIGVFMFRYGGTTSPFSLLAAASAVVIFRKVVIPCWLSKLLAWVTPSVFAVYLLHTNPFGFRILHKLESNMIQEGTSVCMVYIVVAIVLFAGGTVADIPRRVAIWCFAQCRAGKEHR